MVPPTFALDGADAVLSRATALAEGAGRGAANIEDLLRASLQLVGGLEILDPDRANEWRVAIDDVLRTFALSILKTERSIGDVIQNQLDNPAADNLISFLLSFASRTASRERLNVFTTNYDRLIEYGCDLVGLRPVDRFVGGLSPVFRSSRLEIDMHYDPPGIRGEPRYLEGVIKLTKLHGSLDWRYEHHVLTKRGVAFGAGEAVADLPRDPYDALIIYPNPAKDVETLEYPYADLFRDFAAGICRPNSALVTYGYGFGDDHINRVIEDMLTIPSTHLVVVSYSDVGGRIGAFLQRVGRHAQVSYLLGSHFGDLQTLVTHYLPKPAIDTITIRKADLQRRREHLRSPGLDDVGETGSES
jgi:hypothetical protein